MNAEYLADQPKFLGPLPLMGYRRIGPKLPHFVPPRPLRPTRAQKSKLRHRSISLSVPAGAIRSGAQRTLDSRGTASSFGPGSGMRRPSNRRRIVHGSLGQSRRETVNPHYCQFVGTRRFSSSNQFITILMRSAETSAPAVRHARRRQQKRRLAGR